MSTWPGLQVHRWMYCWRKISTIIGTLMEIENWQIRGQAPQDSLCWMKNHRMDIRGPGWDSQEDKRPPDQTLCGLRFGKICMMRWNAKKNKSVLSRNRSSTMLDKCVVFTSLILMMRNSKLSWIMRVESWKFRCQLECFANLNVRSTGKPVALKRIARQNTLALLRPMNLRGSTWNDLFTRIMKIILQEKEKSLSHNNLVRKFIPMPQVMKKQTQQLHWRKNGRKLEKYQHGSWRSHKQKRGDRWSKEWGQNRTFCVANGSLSSQEFVVGATVSEIQRSSCIPRWHCKRWFRILCSIHWAGIISITNDGCKK